MYLISPCHYSYCWGNTSGASHYGIGDCAVVALSVQILDLGNRKSLLGLGDKCTYLGSGKHGWIKTHPF